MIICNILDVIPGWHPITHLLILLSTAWYIRHQSHPFQPIASTIPGTSPGSTAEQRARGRGSAGCHRDPRPTTWRRRAERRWWSSRHVAGADDEEGKRTTRNAHATRIPRVEQRIRGFHGWIGRWVPNCYRSIGRNMMEIEQNTLKQKDVVVLFFSFIFNTKFQRNAFVSASGGLRLMHRLWIFELTQNIQRFKVPKHVDPKHLWTAIWRPQKNVALRGSLLGTSESVSNALSQTLSPALLLARTAVSESWEVTGFPQPNDMGMCLAP